MKYVVTRIYEGQQQFLTFNQEVGTLTTSPFMYDFKDAKKASEVASLMNTLGNNKELNWEAKSVEFKAV